MTELIETTWGAREPDRFGRALLVAFGIEAALLLMLALQPPPPAPVAPEVVKLQMLPPAPVEHAKPQPPQPPPPTPQPAVPITPPVPVPPPPPPRPNHPVMRTRPHPLPPPPPQLIAAPLPPAPVTEAPPPSPAAQQSALSRYTGMLRAIVLSHLEVPDDVSSAGITSTCTLRFTVAPDGSILSVAVAEPSGMASVNQAALSALRGSRFPGFLANMPNHPIEFLLPVRVSGDGG